MQTDQIIIYQTSDGQTAIDVKLENETIWLTQRQIASLFGTKVPAINKHIGNIYKSEELDDSTISILEIVQNEGQRKIQRIQDVYNLDMILSIGYRVNSSRATQFRIWANKVLKEYLIKGYSINEKRLKDQAEQFLSFRALFVIQSAAKNLDPSKLGITNPMKNLIH